MEQRRGAWIYCAIDAPDDTHDTLKEQFKQLIEYSVAAKPSVRKNGNHLSG